MKRRSVLRPIKLGAKTVVYDESVTDIGKGEVSKAFPVGGRYGEGVASGFYKWLDRRASPPKKRSLAPKRALPKVGFWKLLSFSTPHERVCMACGILCAAISGSSIPIWLILLNNSINAMLSTAAILNAIGGGGSEGLVSMISEQLVNLVIAFALVGVVSLVSGCLYVALWTFTGERQSLRIKEEFVKAAFLQDAEWFDQNNPQELPTKVANAMQDISDALGRKIADTFMNLWAAIFCLAVSLWLDAPLAIAMICVVPVIAFVYAVIGVFIRSSSQQSSQSLSEAGAVAFEAISGIKTVASLCSEPWVFDRYHNLGRQSQKSSVKSGFLSSLTAGITGFLFYMTITIAFLIGTEQVAASWTFECILDTLGFLQADKRCYSGAAVMVCIYGVILCATFFGMMGPGLGAINVAQQSAAELFDTIEREPNISVNPNSDDGLVLENLEGAIDFQSILFTYPSRPRNVIFQDLHLTILPGESVGLVGPSGSGKSTISKLLLRFYDPIAGQVTVDDVNLKLLNVSWWRDQVGYVAQEPIIFPGSVRDNIAMGKPGATDEEIVAAAKAACAHDFIMELPDQYSTFYSGTSIQLSGGQMQRISIARAIVKNPILLLLDEATSALDSASEQVVLEAIENIRRTRTITTVSVAHRLSTIMNCDKIAVINHGHVAELGSHRELLELGKVYATLCESQGITLESTSIEKQMSIKLARAKSQKSQSMLKQIGGLVSEQDDAVEMMADEEFEDEEESPSEVEEKDLALSRLWYLNKPEWGYIFMGVIGAIIVGALSPSEGIFTARIVENYYTVDASELRAVNFKWTMGFVFLAFASLIFNLFLGCGFSVSGYRLTRRMRAFAFESILRHSMGWFDSPDHSTGELTTRLEEDCGAVAKVTGWALGYKVRVIATLTAGVVIALAFSWQIGIVAILCVPVIMAATFVQTKCAKPRAIETEGLSPATILESGLRGISSVHAYNLQAKFCQDYSTALKPYSKGKTREGMIAGAVFGLSQCAIFMSFSLLFFVGSKLLIDGKIGFAQFFTAILAVMFGALGAGQVGADFNATREGIAAAERTFDLIDEKHDHNDPFGEEGLRPSQITGAINFKSVCFSYPTRPEHPIYYPSRDRDGLNLLIGAKESVAFVGKSGCGKSTALQLVLRFYTASSGQVLLDENDIEELNLRWLRRQIGYVGQLPTLFSGTVRSNILLGNEGATEDEVIAAAKAANAHDFIMGFTNGYDTDIGTGGNLMSGGQKQRIAIARAIVKNPKILILDEATAALDNESERIVQAALDELQRKQPRTTLVVAHRLVTVKNCTKICVLDKGGVKELGSHEELIAQKGLYYDLWKKQGASDE